jgi:hypothetical protein
MYHHHTLNKWLRFHTEQWFKRRLNQKDLFQMLEQIKNGERRNSLVKPSCFILASIERWHFATFVQSWRWDYSETVRSNANRLRKCQMIGLDRLSSVGFGFDWREMDWHLAWFGMNWIGLNVSIVLNSLQITDRGGFTFLCFLELKRTCGYINSKFICKFEYYGSQA